MAESAMMPSNVRIATSRLVVIAIMGSVLACGQSGTELDTTDEARGERYAITNVDVVPMDTDTVRTDQTVLVESGRISAISSADTIEIPAGYEEIDGTDKYLAPGLADMHAHPMTQLDLDAYVANGITLIRSMWGEPVILGFRDSIAAGDRVGPRIVTGGRIVDGDPVIHYGTDRVVEVADAEGVVATQKAAGYDFIKVYSNLSLQAFDSIVTAAKDHDIPFAGHIPTAVPTEHAFRSGMRTAEHLFGIRSATAVEGAEPVDRILDPAFEDYASRLGTGELQLIDVYDEAKLTAIAELAAETGIWTVPTLATRRGSLLSPTAIERERQRPAMNYVDYAVAEFWRVGDLLRVGWSTESYRGAELEFAHELTQVKAFHDAGARILAGTDAPNPYAFVGFGLVDELELFVAAGLSKYEALQTATTAAAEFMGEAGAAGIVAEGARADLVLLDENPLEDISAYRHISGVMSGDNWLDRSAIDNLLTGIRANSKRNASVFSDAPQWPLSDDEHIVFRAEFVLTQAGESAGAERIAPVQAPDGNAAVLGQKLEANGTVRNYRAEVGASGAVRRIVIDQLGGDGASTQQVLETRGSGPTIITGTALDWLTLSPTLTSMQDGDTRRISVQGINDRGDLEPQEMTVTRHPSDVLVGHFYWTGANRYDVSIKGSNETTELSVWMGGGFYSGWPVKITVQTEALVELSIDYRRIL